MAKSTRRFIAEQVSSARSALRQAMQAIRRRGPSQIQFWFIALMVGIAAGFAALVFRKAISALQTLMYGHDDVRAMVDAVDALPWWWVVLIPIVGGLAVGVILQRFTPDGRVRSVADVIEGSALHDGRVEMKAGAASAVASWITLSTGGSTGREGPVVHIAGMISTWVSNRMYADGITARDLLGCAVAAAVSASFNAPIAGALFALEVVLRHFAVHAFAPIVIASAAGTVINRLEFGDVTEYSLPETSALAFYVELPAFLILGLLSGLVAVILMKSVFWTDDVGNYVQDRFGIPGWIRPGIAGALLGGIAVFYPHIIGVGYETTSAALTGNLLLYEAIVFAALKVVAVAITMAGRMGGGIFSPSLMLGALTGLAFGIIATGFFPDVSGSELLYALAGMGAVAAAVLGAPISTTLIVFELTGDWQTGLAVMVAVSMSTALASRIVDRSFFLTQLERRNVHLAAGPQAYLLSVVRVAKIMRPLGHPRAAPEERCWDLIGDGVYLDGNASLETAMPVFERANHDFIPVVSFGSETEPPQLLGALFQVDALKAYNRALAETAAEEHS
ncbi:MAG: chloride channel protein [Dinoroseobacter sp.]|nr:chloride channel protein [Dinoroseobacter sp.]